MKNTPFPWGSPFFMSDLAKMNHCLTEQTSATLFSSGVYFPKEFWTPTILSYIHIILSFIWLLLFTYTDSHASHIFLCHFPSRIILFYKFRSFIVLIKVYFFYNCNEKKISHANFHVFPLSYYNFKYVLKENNTIPLLYFTWNNIHTLMEKKKISWSKYNLLY